MKTIFLSIAGALVGLLLSASMALADGLLVNPVEQLYQPRPVDLAMAMFGIPPVAPQLVYNEAGDRHVLYSTCDRYLLGVLAPADDLDAGVRVRIYNSDAELDFEVAGMGLIESPVRPEDIGGFRTDAEFISAFFYPAPAFLAEEQLLAEQLSVVFDHTELIQREPDGLPTGIGFTHAETGEAYVFQLLGQAAY